MNQVIEYAYSTAKYYSIFCLFRELNNYKNKNLWLGRGSDGIWEYVYSNLSLNYILDYQKVCLAILRFIRGLIGPD